MTAATPALDGQSVLVVEDEFLIAELICEAVAQLGGKVVGPAPSIEAAFEMLEAGRPDIALLDVNLGGQRVYPLADALWRAHVPFAFTSGYYSEFIEQRFKSAPHLEKPFSMPSLERVLKELVSAGAASEVNRPVGGKFTDSSRAGRIEPGPWAVSST